MSSDDMFDLSRFALPPGTVETTTPKRVQKRREKFVQVPWLLIDALAPHTTDKAWLVLLHPLRGLAKERRADKAAKRHAQAVRRLAPCKAAGVGQA